VHGECITLPLGLAGVTIVRQSVNAQTGGVTVVVRRTATGAICPWCGRWTAKRHDARQRAKLDTPLGERMVTLVVERRRFRCLPCGRVFTEPDEVCGARKRLTRRLRERVGQAAGQAPVAHVANRYGVSEATVRQALRLVAEPRVRQRQATPVSHLGIDEVSLRRGRRYATGLHDLERGQTVELVEGRTSAAVQAALERLADPAAVTVVSMDMSQAFRAAVHLVCPKATITVDKFHVVARLNEALRAVYQRLVPGRRREDPLRQIRPLLLRAGETLSEAHQAQLQAQLRAYPDLKHAWLLKEDFRRWYRTPLTPGAARLELRAWRGWIATEAHLPEFTVLASMFGQWQEEILSYFATRVTQGMVEGKNRRAKVIQAQAYGYRNFANYRHRLLLAG
jgi:transposase